MKTLSPVEVFQRLQAELPTGSLENLVLIGSLAAAYHFREQMQSGGVRTKDADLLLYPRDEAERSGQEMAISLLRQGWEQRRDFGQPLRSPDPVDKLPAIRLYPPKSKDFFVEFLTVPTSETELGKTWSPIQLEDGWYGLCSFEFLGLVTEKPLISSFGIAYARPSMMALANLLSHPDILPSRMGAPYGGRLIKRSNKDLGRILALAWLSDEETEDWAFQWQKAIQKHFPSRWEKLSIDAAKGMEALLKSKEDLEEAWFTCDVGLLNGLGVTVEALRLTGERLMQDVLEPFALSGKSARVSAEM